MSLLRPISPADHATVLAWNTAHVELLSPLDQERLATLLGWCDRGCLIIDGGRDVGFVLTFAAGSAYDSPNFRWFSSRYDAFYYLDRIVVEPDQRRTGVASRAYDEIEERARQVGPVMCLEVNLDPPNEPSLEFHRRRGYVEVGQDDATGHVVSLMAKDL
jgi:uncharacterized protein